MKISIHSEAFSLNWKNRGLFLLIGIQFSGKKIVSSLKQKRHPNFSTETEGGPNDIITAMQCIIK